MCDSHAVTVDEALSQQRFSEQSLQKELIQGEDVMPRIYTSGNDAIDFCARCYPTSEDAAEKTYGNEAKYGEGPDDRGNCFGYDAEHPDYDSTDYRCKKCRKRLTSDDN